MFVCQSWYNSYGLLDLKQSINQIKLIDCFALMIACLIVGFDNLHACLLACLLHYSNVWSCLCCRYIAIVFPIKAHIVCTRRRVVFVIVCVWFLAVSCCVPTALFNDVIHPSEAIPHTMCITRFSQGQWRCVSTIAVICATYGVVRLFRRLFWLVFSFRFRCLFVY